MTEVSEANSLVQIFESHTNSTVKAGKASRNNVALRMMVKHATQMCNDEKLSKNVS